MINRLFCFVLYKIVKWPVTEETRSLVSGKTGERVNILMTEECGRTVLCSLPQRMLPVSLVHG